MTFPDHDDQFFDSSTRVRVLPEVFNRKLPVSVILPSELKELPKVKAVVGALREWAESL